MFSSNNTRWAKAARHIAIGVALFGSIAHATAANATNGDTFYGITGSRRIVTFNSANTCKMLSNKRIWGMQPGEKVLGIDVRPANGQLYALGSTSRLYTLDPDTGQAWAIGTQPFSVTLNGTSFGFDFNPTVDRIRIVSNAGQNLRAHPDTGALVATDKELVYAGGAPAKPRAVAAAYTNPDTDPATGTTLFDIDSALDLLSTQNPPNDGVLNIVGVLGQNVTRFAGFDISKANVGYAAILRDNIGDDNDLDADAKGGDDDDGACGASRLVTVDLATGKATEVGVIGVKNPIRALAVQLR
jgi:hypothetical protein